MTRGVVAVVMSLWSSPLLGQLSTCTSHTVHHTTPIERVAQLAFEALQGICSHAHIGAVLWSMHVLSCMSMEPIQTWQELCMYTW